MNPMEEGLFAWFTVNYLLGSGTSVVELEIAEFRLGD